MTITLQVIEGPGRGRKIFLQSGERVTVGRTDEADYSFAENGEMSSVHFAVNCEWPECYVHDLDSSNGTLLNGEAITHAELKQGDRIKVGNDIFHVRIGDGEHSSYEDISWAAPGMGTAEPALPVLDSTSPGSAVPSSTGPASTVIAEPPVAEGPSIVPVRNEPPGFVPGTVADICEKIEDLDDAARELVEEGQTHEQFVAVLEEKEMFVDASRFLAHSLARRDAVEWAANCVERACGSGLTDADSHALKVTRAWIDDPSEGNRRAAMAAAEALGHKTPSSWAAVGAFWSEGSLAPAELPVVPPAPHFTALAAAGSVMLAAVDKEPERQSEKYHEFFEMGIKQGESSPRS